MGKYQVIYTDPPWSYRQQGKTARGIAANHYSTMSTEDICNLPVRDIATDTSVLFIWSTFPNIREAFKVIDAWDFIYKTAAFVWIKKNKRNKDTNFWGMGAYTRANAEVCLLAVSKGTKPGKQILRHDIHQIIEAPVMLHSEKPREARDRIEMLFGDVPRIELFAREKALGWDALGYEIDEMDIRESIKKIGGNI
ncbi:MT-A70 family methyltransferase [Clostridium sp. Mt-5]|uniref:MT-A70 family methyltransferase n=1 Tax=Clostridium moutaii TaxID=3240932 RepID=A0ABV4BV12_9CLOT